MSLVQQRLAKTFPGLVHVSMDAGPDDRDDYDYDAGESPCCMASATRGPRACTCWEPVYDAEQTDPAGEVAAVRARCCGDCAYLNGSPERRDGYGEELLDLAGGAHQVFACHQGMRRIVAYVHPSGRRIEAQPGDYDPPVVDGVAYKIDGSPAELCAGWAAHRRALLGAEA